MNLQEKNIVDILNIKNKLKTITMKHLKFFSLFAIISITVNSQTGTSGFMKPAGKTSISLSTAFESYNDVFLVPEEIEGVPVFNEVTKISYNLYAEYGISDRFLVSVNLPYIVAEGNASDAVLQETGFGNKRKGFQDLSLNIKYLAKSFDLKKSNLDLLVNFGYETPLSNYKANEGLQSIIAIGNQSNRINGIGILHFKTAKGFFSTGQLGYSARSGDVPNAILSQLKLGYAGANFYGDAFIGSQKSIDGVDILGEGFTGFFPATRVSYTQIGINLFAPVNKSLGLSAGGTSIVNGRNIGKAIAFYGGLNYSF